MATTFSNLAPSQGHSMETRKPQNVMRQVGNALNNVSQSTQKKVSSTAESMLARVLFRQPNFNFLDIPTANLNISQQEMIDDLNEKMP